jgi:hypothetical protein
MAKAGISLEFEPYSRRDPVSGATKTFIRNKHARQSSRRLKALQACVRDGMMGFTARSGDHAANARAVRERLAATARACSGRGGR